MNFEHRLESMIFASRWLLAPFFVGLIVAIIVLLFKFMKELVYLIVGAWDAAEYETVVAILTMVDTALLAILLLIIIFSGYENFVSKLGIGDHEDRPAWMGKIGFSDLKLKLIGAIVAISAVELLKGFLISTQYSDIQLLWKIGIHLTFVVSGVLFAVTDRIIESGRPPKPYGDEKAPARADAGGSRGPRSLFPPASALSGAEEAPARADADDAPGGH